MKIKKKVKQGPKPGKVVRLDPLILDFVMRRKRGSETMSSVLRRLLGLPGRRGEVAASVHYALPSTLFDTVEEARGHAVLESVAKKRQPIEKPIRVRTVE